MLNVTAPTIATTILRPFNTFNTFKLNKLTTQDGLMLAVQQAPRMGSSQPPSDMFLPFGCTLFTHSSAYSPASPVPLFYSPPAVPYPALPRATAANMRFQMPSTPTKKPFPSLRSPPQAIPSSPKMTINCSRRSSTT